MSPGDQARVVGDDETLCLALRSPASWYFAKELSDCLMVALSHVNAIARKATPSRSSRAMTNDLSVFRIDERYSR